MSIKGKILENKNNVQKAIAMGVLLCGLCSMLNIFYFTGEVVELK